MSKNIHKEFEIILNDYIRNVGHLDANCNEDLMLLLIRTTVKFFLSSYKTPNSEYLCEMIDDCYNYYEELLIQSKLKNNIK